MLIRNIVVAFFLTFFVNAMAHAGYDKAAWGMTLKKVQTLYPGGHAQKNQNGNTTYNVVRPVAGFDTAFIMFSFAGKSGLKDVKIFFPKQGEPVDLKGGVFSLTSNADALQIFTTLRTALVLKYGKPASEKADQIGWSLANNDAVILSILADQSPGHATAAISYEAIPTLDKLSNGL